MKKAAALSLIFLSAMAIALIISGKSFLLKAVWYYKPNIDDYKIFYNRQVPAGTDYEIPNAVAYNKKELPSTLSHTLSTTKTVAFLVIKNDSVVQEHYWNGYTRNSYSGSFSVAKSIISALVGIAIKEGKIKSVDEPVGNYLPDFKNGLAAQLTIKHLLMMSSGSSWDESYSSATSITTEGYYGFDIDKTMSGIKIVEQPGKVFNYKSGDTQLLGMLLKKACGMNVADYASEKLWKPLGASKPALWSLDKENGSEKCFCCFNSNARDFSRLGLLFLHKGNWRGRQIIDTSWVEESTRPNLLPDTDGGVTDYYGYQWWIAPNPEQFVFYARGILGQYIIVVPEKNIVMVRLGEKRGEKTRNHTLVEVDDMIQYAINNL